MTDTPNLGLPFIEGGQAQKHVTHNEALRILDAAIQIAVQDTTRTAPPASPDEGQRHVVAAGAGGAWAGQGHAIASWQDDAWAFLAPHAGWCVWSVADDAMLVFDGAGWRAVGLPALDSVGHLGINTSADANNLLSVKSGAALFAAIDSASGGSGDVRLQLSKESASNTASVVFSDNYSGRAEFGLVGSNAFKLKVSPDGSSFTEAFTIDQATGNLALPRGLALTGVVAPEQILANQNDYSPAGLAAAGVLQISSDAARSLSGLGGGAEGRVMVVINVGGAPLTLLDDNAASLAANRFSLGGNLTLAAKQSALLRYDGTAARWQPLAGGLALRADSAQPLTAAQRDVARDNVAGVGVVRRQKFTASGTYMPHAKMLSALVECIGGGGGGGGAAASPSGYSSGGGGGGGGYSALVVAAATIGASKTVTIGAGGGAGAVGGAGGSGGDTSVGTLCIARGGSGGGGAPTNSPGGGGAGGSAGTGDDVSAGNIGGCGLGSGLLSTALQSGMGAPGPWGGGGGQVTAGPGNSATGYGGGGSGGASYASGTGTSGGAGFAGYVRITEFCSS